MHMLFHSMYTQFSHIEEQTNSAHGSDWNLVESENEYDIKSAESTSDKNLSSSLSLVEIGSDTTEGREDRVIEPHQ